MTKKQSNSRRPKAKLTQNNASTTTWHTECTNECILAITLISLLPGGSDGKASVCNAGDPGSIPGSGGSPGEGNGSPRQYSCLENPMDCGAWQATIHGVAKSQTRLSDFTSLHLILPQLLQILFWTQMFRKSSPD